MSDPPVVQFDETRAVKIFPRPDVKTAALVSIPQFEGGVELCTYLATEWGGIQQFLGDYYLIIRDGQGVYGSAKDQWLGMHTEIRPGEWVKTATPVAYQVTETCKVVTLILEEEGIVRETSVVIGAGDWVVRQPGGEVQHIKQGKMAGIYFTPQEVAALGLDQMTQDQFTAWATAQVRVNNP